MKKENERGYEVILFFLLLVLISGAITGLILCWFSGMRVFCEGWPTLLLVGIGLGLVWMVMNKIKSKQKK